MTASAGMKRVRQAAAGWMTVVGLGLLAACGSTPVGGESDGGDTGGVPPAADGGTQPGTGTDAGTAPMPGWNPQTKVGPERDRTQLEVGGIDVDLSETGEVLLVWSESGETRSSAWLNRATGGRWEQPLRLTAEDVVPAAPRVALNDSGDAVVVYRLLQMDGPHVVEGSTVWARRRVQGTWQEPERISAAPTESGQLHTSDTRVGIDAEGHAVVAWSQQGSPGAGVFASVHGGTGWSAPQRLDEGTLPSRSVQLAVSASGTAVVVWTQDTKPYDPGQSGGGPRNPNVFARALTAGTWGAATRIGSNDLADHEFATNPSVVMDAAGRAFALWEERRTASNRMVAARFAAGEGWGAPQQVAASQSQFDDLVFSSIATDGAGNAFAVWEADVPDGSTAHGTAAFFDGATGTWSAPSPFETAGSLEGTRAAMSTAGTGLALFTAPGEGSFEVRARAFTLGGGWGEPVVIGRGWVQDAEGNSAGALVVGARLSYYANSQPLARDVPTATLYLPEGSLP